MVFRAGVVVPRWVPAFLVGLRSALTPVDSCAEAHLPTVVLRRLVLRMAHGVGGLNLVSDALRSRVFDLLRRDSKHSKRKSRADFRLLRVSPTPNLTAFRNASGLVIFLVASWMIMTLLCWVLSSLVRTRGTCPIPIFGALRWASWGWVAW